MDSTTIGERLGWSVDLLHHKSVELRLVSRCGVRGSDVLRWLTRLIGNDGRVILRREPLIQFIVTLETFAVVTHQGI